ncbi:hypothetical protein GF377_02600 [candidate division GN15 bacterium]|nr:hypothetical protein [candidate division GN15 bacterium]
MKTPNQPQPQAREKRTKDPCLKATVRCAYLSACYLADELRCFGYMTDCPLYLKSNGEPCSESRFHAAMDRLIDRTRAKHERLQRLDSEAPEKP